VLSISYASWRNVGSQKRYNLLCMADRTVNNPILETQDLRIDIRLSRVLSINVTRVSIAGITPIWKLLARVVDIEGGIWRSILRLSLPTVEIHSAL